MKWLKLVGALVMAISALTAIASTTASAALPEFLPAKGNFSATSGKGTLKAGAFSIICASDQVKTGNGKVTGAKTLVTTVDFLKCEILGQPANTLGDLSGVILVELGGELCFIKATAPLEVGVYFTVLPTSGIHIEIPSLSDLVIVKGTVILKAEPINVSQKASTLKTKESEFKECSGKAAELLSSLNGGKFELAKETTTEEATFEENIEVMG